MEKRKINKSIIKDFSLFLLSEEKSKATTDKYVRDVYAFFIYVKDAEITKQTVIAYKISLKEKERPEE